MDEIEQRLRETADITISAYEEWVKVEKDGKSTEKLQEAVHNLRKVASRLEIEMAVSERNEMAQKPLPVPHHRSSRNKRPHHNNNKNKSNNQNNNSNNKDNSSEDNISPTKTITIDKPPVINIDGPSVEKKTPRRRVVRKAKTEE